MPYEAMCKVFYRRGGAPWVASGWIVRGDNGRKGIITSGHVVYQNGAWSQDYLVCRQYSRGAWAEQFRGNFARTLHGWIHGQGAREFWDLGAIIPERAIPDSTPSLPVVFGYDPSQAPFNFFSDTGYPAKPANGFPFDGELQWESAGPLITVHRSGDQYVMEAYNAMEQGSSGSPWLVRDPMRNLYFAAGMQSSGWDGVPSSYSPYFDQRNLIALLRDIGVWGGVATEEVSKAA
jgi:V8-like Glu-specific endopeptidase